MIDGIHDNNKSVWFYFKRIAGFLFRVWLCWVSVCLACVLVFVVSLFLFPPVYSQTTDIADYGIYEGTNNDSRVQAQIKSFFPAEIADSFEVIQYSYSSENEDSYGFEAYLEIRIADKEAFDRQVQSIAPAECWQEFPFCDGYLEYCITNEMGIWKSEQVEQSDCYQIDRADVKKVLYSPSEQTIIYVAIGVFDGGAADTEFLGVFFDRFGIDPKIYVQTTTPYVVEVRPLD